MCTERYVNPFTDFGFKLLFGTPANKEFLIGFLNSVPDFERDKVFERFFRAAEIAKFSPEQRLAYETSLKIMRDYNNTVKSAEEKGVLRGLEEGIEQGRAEGRAEGRSDGRTEKAVEIAHKMIRANMSVTDISDMTGLPTHEIERLSSASN